MSATRVRRPSRYSGIAQPAGSADPDANAGRRRAARSYCSIEIRDRDPSVYMGTTQGSKQQTWDSPSSLCSLWYFIRYPMNEDIANSSGT